MIPVLLCAIARDMDGNELGVAPIEAELRDGAFWQVKHDNTIAVYRSGYIAFLEMHWIDAGVWFRCEVPLGIVMETDLIHFDWKDKPIGRISEPSACVGRTGHGMPA